MSFKVKDHYYKKAKRENFLARSVYKLDEIDNKYNVIKKNDRVLDLGYFPGSWIQYVSAKIGNDGLVVGLDIQEINTKLLHIKNVELFRSDIFEVKKLVDLNVSSPFNVVISDMAPKTTGIKCVDQDRSLGLVEEVFNILPIFLGVGGNFVIKIFDSQQAQTFLRANGKRLFQEFYLYKPKSTRSVSKEFFAVGKKYKNQG